MDFEVIFDVAWLGPSTTLQSFSPAGFTNVARLHNDRNDDVAVDVADVAVLT